MQLNWQGTEPRLVTIYMTHRQPKCARQRSSVALQFRLRASASLAISTTAGEAAS
jgi:hypothetical protein